MPKNNRDFFKEKNNWSEIKDRLLACYLPQYFQKVLMTGKPIFYVDCFSGKGKFDDGNLGSPIIALQIRDACLTQTSNKDGKIETHFIELNHAEELASNISIFNNSNGQPFITSGKYEETIEGLLEKRNNYNVFLYVDPYGIKALDFSLFNKFQNSGFASFEILVNFNSFGFIRDACRVMSVDYNKDEALNNLEDLIEYEPTQITSNKQSENILNSIANGDYWKKIITEFKNGAINGYQAEKAFSAEYKQQLKKGFAYVLDMPIRLKEGQRPKYRMIHACNHKDGCFLMAKNMQSRKEELFIDIQQGGQISLFDFDPSVSSTAENEIINEDEVLALVKEHLLIFDEDVKLTNFIASFLNKHGLLCDFKMIYNALGKLEEIRFIEITRKPALTENGRKRTFWEEKKNQTLTLRRVRL